MWEKEGEEGEEEEENVVGIKNFLEHDHRHPFFGAF